MENLRFVISVIAKDDVGITSAIAKILAESSGNWLDSKMIHLGDQFAGAILVEAELSQFNEISKKLESLENQDFKLRISIDKTNIKNIDTKTANIEVIGHDQSGIVSQISQVLSENAVNIEQLDSSIKIAPESGQNLFVANLQVALPFDVDKDNLLLQLEKTAAQLMVEISMKITD